MLPVLVLLAACGAHATWPPCPSGQFAPCATEGASTNDKAALTALATNNDDAILLGKTFALSGRVPEQAAVANPASEPGQADRLTLTTSNNAPVLGTTELTVTQMEAYDVVRRDAVPEQAGGSVPQPSTRRLLRAA